MLAWTIWNLFLAVLPIPLGDALSRRMATGGLARPRRLATVSLAVAWLLLLPNAPYLLTEIRHYVLDPSWRRMTALAPHDPAAWRAAAGWGLAFALYGAVGVFAFTRAVRPVESAWLARGLPLWPFRLVLCGLTAHGVWLGLVPRFNSWDVIARPGEVLGATRWAATHLPTALCIAVFALVLAGLHALVDAAWRGRRSDPRFADGVRGAIGASSSA
jgi:uncharacterized membrane protein